MSSSFKFLRRVRIHGGECGAVARALHHEAKGFSPCQADLRKALESTIERKQMSTKTTLKRIALVAVAALGLGVLSVGPSANAAVLGETLTIDAATDTVVQGDTATAVITHQWTSTEVYDSAVIKATCTAPSGGTCPTTGLSFSWTATADSTSATMLTAVQTSAGAAGAYAQNTAATTGYQESSSVTSAAVKGVVTIKFVASTTQKVGDYVISVYSTKYNAGAVQTLDKSVNWTVTVSAGNTDVAGLNTYFSDDITTALNARTAFKSSIDSATVHARGTVGTYTPVTVGYAVALNSASDSKTAALVNICATACSVTVNLSGPGMLKLGGVAKVGGTTGASGDAGFGKSVTLSLGNAHPGLTSETFTVYSDGTAGTGTITMYSGSVLLKTKTVIFAGATAGTINSVGLSDTTTVKGQSSVTLSGTAKDSSGNFLAPGALVYLYSSDTGVAGSFQNSATALNTGCTAITGAAGRFSCAVTVTDTGTAILYVKDSNTVAASTVSSDAITMTVLGAEASSFTVSFDKATYTLGERAVITITGKDVAARALANTTTAISSIAALGGMTASTTNPEIGTVSGAFSTTTFTGYSNLGVESGVETRVVVMPSYASDVSFSLTYTQFQTTTPVKVTATAKVTDPNAALIAAAEAAAKKAGADAVASAEAATDAAAEAIDAANAATDAANLAAEAADAATVAAEEARDAADAATAAVEELATQVATLMAALKAQITTLANTVAKIAKKVKA